MQAVSITNVFEVPVKEVIQQLGTAQEIFARMTPSDDSTGGKPAGWEVLTTMELLFQVCICFTFLLALFENLYSETLFWLLRTTHWLT